MGAYPSLTLPVTSDESSASLQDALLEQHAVLKQYTVEKAYATGSGRLFRTFRVRHGGAPETVALCKAAWLKEEAWQYKESSYDNSNNNNKDNAKGNQDDPSSYNNNNNKSTIKTAPIQSLLAELEHLQRASRQNPAIVSYTAWCDRRLATTTIHQSSNTTTSSSNTNNNGLVAVRAVALLRPYIYTTLKDRLSSRPFWNMAEKTWVIVQLLAAVQGLHEAGLRHGHLSTDNVGLTSLGRVLLMDGGLPALKKTYLPDNDPTEYLYYFQKTSYATTSSPEETPCTLAPERFVAADTGNTTSTWNSSSSSSGNASATTTTASSQQQQPQQGGGVTPAMDIFSVGCLVVEICLNEGSSCFDHLGQLLAYARGDDSVLQQRLGKMESSALRAAAKHMLSRQASERLSAAGYLQRLQATGLVPETFALLDALVADTTTRQDNTTTDAATSTSTTSSKAAVVTPTTPDARMVQCVQKYPAMVKAALGRNVSMATMAKWHRWTQTAVPDKASSSTAAAAATTTAVASTSPPSSASRPMIGATEPLDFAQMLAETEALLKSLNQQVVVPDSSRTTGSTAKQATTISTTTNDKTPPQEETEERSELCRSSMIIYLQIVLSTLRQVQRPASKWVALQLVHDMSSSNYVTDEARLQRIVPLTVSLLQDSDALVRATALTVLTHALSQVTVFSPSDAPIIPQYVAKRVSHLPADPALVVRLAFAQCMPLLAEVAQRFLDVTHAVRIYEAVGGGTSNTSGYTTEEEAVFSEDVTQLLDNTTTTTTTSRSESGGEKAICSNKILLGSTYMSEREGLNETVSRWVLHMATDQSEDASLPKRAMLHHTGRLCTFFGQQTVMSFLLPQIVTFLNDRKDWQLRAALFQNLTPVCQNIGRAATEEFALPCLEIGFVDSEEQVIRCALDCLCQLIELGLLSRGSLLGTGESFMDVRTNNDSLLERYAIFLIHPCEGIRKAAIAVFVKTCQVVGSPDTFVYILPTLKPLLKYQPTVKHLQDGEKLQRCLQSSWTRAQFERELEKFSTRPSSGAWTAVGIQISDSTTYTQEESDAPKKQPDKNEIAQIQSTKEYLRMLAMHNAQTSSVDSQQSSSSRAKVRPCIEANLKLAQSVMFPRQDFRIARAHLPEWFENVQQKTIEENALVSAQSTIKSIADLGAVYGISIMGPIEGTTENIIGAAGEDAKRSDVNPDQLLENESTNIVEASSLGQWSAESVLDPDLLDASLLVSKLKALRVPHLPPKLGEHIGTQKPPTTKATGRTAAREPAQVDWRPRINSLVATSSTISGHKAPVVRLAVSLDSSFFVSGSHDGTCGLWETSQLEDSVGVLESSLVYSGHSESHSARINDVAMVEGTHSVVSGDSNGCVHVWRVDMVESTSMQSGNKTARAVGSSEVRQIHPGEGEILAVTHFTGLPSSVVIYASQKGVIHSWDLRCAQEPFSLRHSPSLGHLTTMALGNDRQWLVSGTNKGYLALWDIRFQNAVKLWRHKSGEKIHRAATSFVPPPQNWAGRLTSAEPRPFVFLGTGANECAMFDLISGCCRECFRTISTDSKLQNEELPSLLDIRTTPYKSVLDASGPQFSSPTLSSYPSINCMVGSVGGQNQSFLVTGGSDQKIRFWDFAAPSRCYAVAGETSSATRSSYERIDFDGPRRLMLCRQPPALALRESGRIGNYAYHGLKKPENYHTDSVMDLKIIDNGVVSCSRDCTVKVWR